MFKLGTVIKYYDKTDVCVVELIADLSVKDKVRVMHKLTDTFEPAIEFIQVGSKKVELAKKNTVVIVKFSQKVREQSEIYRNG